MKKKRGDDLRLKSAERRKARNSARIRFFRVIFYFHLEQSSNALNARLFQIVKSRNSITQSLSEMYSYPVRRAIHKCIMQLMEVHTLEQTIHFKAILSNRILGEERVIVRSIFDVIF